MSFFQPVYKPDMQCNPSAAYWSSRPAAASSSGSWCGVLLFVFLLAMGLWWICSGSSKGTPLLLEDVQVKETGPWGKLREQMDVVAYGDAHTGAAGCSDPGVLAGHAKDFGSVLGGATAPLDVGPPRVASIGGLNLPGSAAAGTALAGAFDMTEPGQEYMAAYNPTGLASVMPAGWRSNADAKGASCKAAAGAAGDSYAEFSRYSISPEAVARSENMRSVLRLSENTRQGMGRTLGYQSLLRNYVTPVGPQPIGDKSMLFNDSSVRQSYIASVTGAFPDLGLC